MLLLIIAVLSVISIVFGLGSVALNRTYNEELGNIFETIACVSVFSTLIIVIYRFVFIGNILIVQIPVGILMLVFVGLIIRAIIVGTYHFTQDFKEHNRGVETSRKRLAELRRNKH